MKALDRCSAASESPEEKELFRLASAAVAFISFSGQLYRFAEFRKGLAPGHARTAFFSRAMALLERTRANTPSPEEAEILLATIDALDFIESTSQRQGLEEYLRSWDLDTLPPVLAAFKTRKEAKAWLNSQSDPPYGARVLIGDEYHTVFRNRERRNRDFLATQAAAIFIERHSRTGLPPVVASFSTRAEADEWLAGQTEPPPHAFILIGGEHHLAVFHKNVNHRAIYPFSVADEWAKIMRRT